MALIFFSAQFIRVISHYKKIGYSTNVLQQTPCLVVNPIPACNFAFLFNCMPVGRTSDYDGFDLKTYLLMYWQRPDALAVCQVHQGLPVGFFLLLQYSVLFTVESLSFTGWER